MSSGGYKTRACTALLLAASLLAAPAAALDWASNSLRILHGYGFELGSGARTNWSWQHLSGWRYGDSFGFLDIIDRADIGAEYYGEFYTWVSLTKVADRPLAFGPVRDLSAGIGINAGGRPFKGDYKAYLAGARAVIDLPLLRHFHVETWAHQADGVDSIGFQITPVWLAPFELGRTRFIFRGFVDFRSNGATGGAPETFSQPEFLLDVGHWWGHDDKLLLGMRWQYSHNKFGIKDVDEDAQQVMLSWEF
ncbi:MAG: DUF5020 domain-containing protein [Gammaproteobacteria bacterium]|nr:DUF5020 domain-containing protein [Gammaproteobacteria bacterium]